MVASIVAASVALSAVVLVEGADRAGGGETMKLVFDSVVATNAMNLASGPFGSCINGQTFQQETLVSF